MDNTGIPQDEAELLSVLLESILYGFSLLMFGGTIWALVSQRSTGRVNRKMFVVACALLLVSTVHIVIGMIRIVYGLILYRDTYPGGPVAFFSDASQWTFLSKNIVYAIQTLIGDGVILYRCYVAWESKLVMILPMTLWCGIAVIGFATPFSGSHVAQWVTGFYATSLSSNLLTTILLAYRIWDVDRETTRLLEHRTSELRPILHIIIDAGVMYPLTILLGLICLLTNSNGQAVILDLVTPIISITFYMVIFRVGLIRAKQTSNIIPLAYSSGDTSYSRGRMRVEIMTSTERKTDDGQYITPAGSTNDMGEIKLDDVRRTVQPEV